MSVFNPEGLILTLAFRKTWAGASSGLSLAWGQDRLPPLPHPTNPEDCEGRTQEADPYPTLAHQPWACHVPAWASVSPAVKQTQVLTGMLVLLLSKEQKRAVGCIQGEIGGGGSLGDKGEHRAGLGITHSWGRVSPQVQPWPWRWPCQAGRAELAEGGGLFFRAWPSLGALLCPAPGTTRPQLGAGGKGGG